MSILYPKSRILIELQREIPVCLPIKRLDPNGSSRFCLHHPLSLPLLRAAGPPGMPELVSAAPEVHADTADSAKTLIFFGVLGIK